MTGPDFTAWLAAVKAAGLAQTEADALALLGYGPDQGIRWKRNGTSHAIALACAAVLAGLKPYGQGE